MLNWLKNLLGLGKNKEDATEAPAEQANQESTSDSAPENTTEEQNQ